VVATWNEIAQVSEQNLRCLGASAVPHSWQVLATGGSSPCHVRLGAGKDGSGDGSRRSPLRLPNISTRL